MEAKQIHGGNPVARLLSWRVLALFLIVNCQLSILNTLSAQEAFYIYQNDGRFNGFFYDEVQKITYSKLDTLGQEFDDYVSQEIVTADSTYRIMLSAIDSVGFVQPETKLNPRLHIRGEDPVFGDFYLLYHVDSSVGGGDEIIVFSRELDEYGPDYLPQVGDVFADFDATYGWSAKVASLTRNYPGYEGQLTAVCKPIDDITDIFRQFVSVEQYGYDEEGRMVGRRVAGRPELSVGRFTKKRAEGNWEGDLFNFSLNGYIPLYAEDDRWWPSPRPSRANCI